MKTEGYTDLKLYEGVRGTAIKILNRVDRTDAYLEKLLEIEIKNSELSSIDKALLYEIVHGVIRWLAKIDWILTGFYKGNFAKCIPNVKNAMRVALYQILFLDKIPEYAAVNEAVEFVKKLQGQKSADLTNGVLRNIIRTKNAIRYPDPEEDLAAYFSAYYSHPSWLVKRWLNRYGKDFTEQLMIANNEKPSLTIRVNKLVSNIEQLKGLLHSVRLKFQEGKYLPDFIKLNSLTNIADWEYFAKGYFSIQDESTGFPCLLLDPQPNQRVLDLCAAPGGKSGILAAMMNNTGELVTVDKFERRMDILNKNLARLKVTNFKSVIADALEFEDESGFDSILIDAPCSGLGTLTKKPDIKWSKDSGDIRKLNELQMALIKKGSSLLRKGGYMVYSTCTIEPDENFEIVKKFLSSTVGYELVDIKKQIDNNLLDQNGCIQTFPHIHGIDGSFAAKIRRIN